MDHHRAVVAEEVDPFENVPKWTMQARQRDWMNTIKPWKAFLGLVSAGRPRKLPPAAPQSPALAAACSGSNLPIHHAISE